VLKLAAVARHRGANTCSLLIFAVLESGEPMALNEVAVPFEEAGIALRGRAYRQLR